MLALLQSTGRLLVLVCITSVTACDNPILRQRSSLALRPTPTPLPTVEVSEPARSASPIEDGPGTGNGWDTIAAGIDLRNTTIPTAVGNVDAVVLRVEPEEAEIRVHYAPGGAAWVSEWHSRLSEAHIVINGGFFYPDRTTLGLLITDGKPHGVSFLDHGGMLTVGQGDVAIRSLAAKPYVAGEAIEQAIQGRPLLVEPDGSAAAFALSNEPSRRTAVGMDAAGRLIIVVVDYGALSLYELRDWMVLSPDPEFAIAFNLDGGGSTGLSISSGEYTLLLDSFSTVPSVLAVYPR